jgi:hypothetical protein
MTPQRNIMLGVVTVLNVVSSIVNLPTAWVAVHALFIGVRGIAYYGPGIIVWGLALAMVYCVLPAVCVMGSTKLARTRSGWAITVALVPVVLVAATVTMLLHLDMDD